MFPGFDNLRMESFMPIHEGFKTMQDDQEEFTVDEINNIHSEEDSFADVQTIKPTMTTKQQTNNNAKNNANNNAKAMSTITSEDDTKEFITKYIESEEPTTAEEVEEKTNRSPRNNKANNTVNSKQKKTTTTLAEVVEPEETGEKEGFQGSMINQMGTNKLILVTLIIVMISFVLNMGNTRSMLTNWLHCNRKATLCVSVIFGLLVYIVLRIFC